MFASVLDPAISKGADVIFFKILLIFFYKILNLLNVALFLHKCLGNTAVYLKKIKHYSATEEHY